MRTFTGQSRSRVLQFASSRLSPIMDESTSHVCASSSSPPRPASPRHALPCPWRAVFVKVTRSVGGRRKHERAGGCELPKVTAMVDDALQREREDTGVFTRHWHPPPPLPSTSSGASDAGVRVWRLGDGRFTVRADFESANLADARCQLVRPTAQKDASSITCAAVGRDNTATAGAGATRNCMYEFLLRTAPDCAGTPFETGNKTWFYFGVRGIAVGETVRVTLLNLNKQSKLFAAGFKPVYRYYSHTQQHRRSDSTRRTTDEHPGHGPADQQEEEMEAKGPRARAGGYRGPLRARESQSTTQDGTCGRREGNGSDPAGESASRSGWARVPGAVDANGEVRGEFRISFPFTRTATVSGHGTGKQAKTRTGKTAGDPGQPPEADGDGDDVEIFFAFAIPWSFEENSVSLGNIRHRLTRAYGDEASWPLVFTRETLTHSLEGRPIDIITISSSSASAETVGARRCGTRRPRHHEAREMSKRGAHALDANRIKPTVFITCRVHPGETPASHMCNGVIDFLLRVRDERAQAARRAFVFKIVPILNPDGVARGHYRCDTRGVNLNRCYAEPDPVEHPAIHALKQLITETHRQQPGALAFLIDLHAHANKKGCFAFGNCHPSAEALAESVAYTKLVAMNCPFFDLSACNFAERNMSSRDRSQSTTKEGSSRVAIFRETGMTHLYTVEANYNTGRVQNTSVRFRYSH